MRLNTKELNPGTRFDVPNDAEGAWVSIRVLDSEASRKIRKATTKTIRKLMRVEGEKRTPPQLVEYDEVDDAAFSEMMWDYCITDFGGWFDDDGTEIPCTRKNKAMLMGQSVFFASFVAESLEALTEAENREQKQRKEDEEKNSQSSQSGGSPEASPEAPAENADSTTE